MKDLRKIVKGMPEEKPLEPVVKMTVAKIVKKEIKRWREKKISWVLIGVLVMLGVLGVLKMLEAAEILDTSGFWLMIKEDPSFLEWQSFLEGFPVTEGLFVIVITLLLIVPIWVIRHKDQIIGR